MASQPPEAHPDSPPSHDDQATEQLPKPDADGRESVEEILPEE